MNEKLIHRLETQCNWNMFFGVTNSLMLDKGFKSTADNFIKSKIIETAFGISANMERVDERGWDFDFQGVKIELKTCKTLIQKRKGNQTTNIKIKNFRGDVEKSSKRFKEEKCFDFLICIGTKDKNIIIVDDVVARSKYEKDGDGMFASFKPDDYYLCKIDEVIPFNYNNNVSKLIDDVIKQWINSGVPAPSLMNFFK